MSVEGHSRRSDRGPATSGLTRSTDIIGPARVVRFVPISEVINVARSTRRLGRLGGDAEGLGDPEIDDQFSLSGLLGRQINAALATLV
jgi:hypothetical protein